MISKFYLRSRTLWIAILLLVVQGVFPKSKHFIRDHYDEIFPIIYLTFIVLRLKTKKAISWTKSNSDSRLSSS